MWSKDLTVQSERFGVNANVMYQVQKDNANRLGIIKDANPKMLINTFIEKLDNPKYSQFGDEFFIS